MCCLRYEHEIYEEALRRTPSVGSIVLTQDGEGVVTEVKPLAGEIKVKLNGNDKDAPKMYKASEVKLIKASKRAKSDDSAIEDIVED